MLADVDLDAHWTTTTYTNAVVSESLAEDLLDNVLMLTFYYAGSCREYSKGAFSYVAIWGLTGLKQGT